MQRRIVDLPEPLEPMITATSPCATSNETPLSTWSAPKLFTTSRTSIIDGMPESSMHRRHLAFEPSRQPRQRKADCKIEQHHGTKDLKSSECALHDLLGRVAEFP